METSMKPQSGSLKKPVIKKPEVVEKKIEAVEKKPVEKAVEIPDFDRVVFPPFDELTKLLYGEPSTGKTTFAVMPREESILYQTEYEHPLFDAAAIRAQRRLWSLQGQRNTWFCGAYFGAGFHEDGLQAGLAAAEQLGGVRRPWRVAEESGRIHVGTREALAA